MSLHPTVPIIDGVVRVPAVMEAAVLRVVSMEGGKQVKRSSIYEAGMELLVEEGTMLEVLSSGNQVILSVECRTAEAKPAPTPVAPTQEEPKSETLDLAKLPFDQRLGYRAQCYYGKPFSALNEEEKTECMIKPDPSAAEIKASEDKAPEPGLSKEIVDATVEFIAPPSSPLEASKTLKAELEADVEAIKDLGGTAEDLQTYQDVMKDLAGADEDEDNRTEADYAAAEAEANAGVDLQEYADYKATDDSDGSAGLSGEADVE